MYVYVSLFVFDPKLYFKIQMKVLSLPNTDTFKKASAFFVHIINSKQVKN